MKCLDILIIEARGSALEQKFIIKSESLRILQVEYCYGVIVEPSVKNLKILKIICDINLNENCCKNLEELFICSKMDLH